MTLDIAKLSSAVRVLDGAWGTELQKRGLPAGHATELWNVENPDAVQAVADSYVQAGSEIILTNTFGANRFVLERHGLSGQVAHLAGAGVAISRRAADKAGALVFAAIGPTGKIVMTGEVSPDDLTAAFAQSARAIADAGADAIVLESFAELEEIELALKAVKAVCSLPVVASMTFGSGPDGTRSVMGTTPEQLAQMASANGAAVVGGNCGAGPEKFVKVAQLLHQASPLPVWIKANAGLPVLLAGKTTFPMGPADFAACADSLIAAGATFLGGCCGTTPLHIRALRDVVDKAASR